MSESANYKMIKNLSYLFNTTYILGALLVSPAIAQTIHDIKGPLSFPPNYGLWIMLAIVLVVGGIGAFVWAKKKGFFGKKESSGGKNLLSPHELAFQRLDRLQQKDLISKGLIKEYYSELSDIVRHYIEHRFSLRAPEMTTEEFLSQLQWKDVFGKEEKDLLKEFLFSCDMVKFAKYGPSREEIQNSMELAKAFIRKTVPIANERPQTHKG